MTPAAPQTINIQVTKKWLDDDNSAETRPDTVTVELYANGAAAGNTLALSASNNWTARFSNLPAAENGQPISYTVKESAVSGYAAAYTGNAKDGFIITNTAQENHTHDYSLNHDETHHWDECSCGDIQSKEPHSYGEWTVTKKPTTTENGEKEHTCTVCEYTETVEIEKLSSTVTYPDYGTPTPTPGTLSPTPTPGTMTSPATGDHSTTWLWFIMLCVSGAFIAGSQVYRKN